ncbi:hypothetical protein GCM10023174_03240 [Chelativorans composti]
MDELLRERQVGTHLPPSGCDLRLVGPYGEEGIGRISGQEPQQDEQDDAGSQQREGQNGKPTKNVS